MVMKTSKGWVKAEGHYFLKLDFCLEYWEVSNADPDNRILFFNSRDNFLIYYFDFMFSILEDLELMHKHIVESVAKYNFLQCSFSEALSNRGIYLTLLGMRVHAFNLFKLIRLARLLLTLKTLKTFFFLFWYFESCSISTFCPWKLEESPWMCRTKRTQLSLRRILSGVAGTGIWV